MRFSPSFIERLRNHFLISEVIGKRIPIKKHGREFQALCPFHNEKTPSFTINDEKGFFHCFGCAAHGDTIEFVKRYERLTYPEAIERLSAEAGIPLPVMTREESKKIEAEKTLYDVLEAACQWFEKQLATPGGTIARDYTEKRALKPETLRQFRVGFAPDEKTLLHQHLLQLGFSQTLQAEAGLIIITDEGRVYDRFRGRLIFPIRNASGKIVAFGGRLLAAVSVTKNLPKYLNSPETPLFKKGELLYNLDLAKRPAREGNMVVVMEGYMDVVSSAQSGIAYAVATLGTAVTPEHLRLLWQLAKEPVICLDGDAAGHRAMQRAAEIALPLLKPGYSLRFAVLPAGEDPDSYVQKHGRASFEKILNSSKRLSQTLWDLVSPQYKLALPEGRAALEHACKQLGEKITDSTVRTHYLSYFRKQLWAKTSTPAAKQISRSPLVEQMIVAHHSAGLETLAQRLLKTLVKFPALLHKSQVEEALSRLDIRNPRLDALRNTLLAALGHGDVDQPDHFLEYLHAQLPDGWLSNFIDESIGIPYRQTLSVEDAMQLWNETFGAYEIAHLHVELKEVEESLGQAMNEDSLSRMVELQHALRKATAGRNFAPAESDIA